MLRYGLFMIWLIHAHLGGCYGKLSTHQSNTCRLVSNWFPVCVMFHWWNMTSLYCHMVDRVWLDSYQGDANRLDTWPKILSGRFFIIHPIISKSHSTWVYGAGKVMCFCPNIKDLQDKKNKNKVRISEWQHVFNLNQQIC